MWPFKKKPKHLIFSELNNNALCSLTKEEVPQLLNEIEPLLLEMDRRNMFEPGRGNLLMTTYGEEISEVACLCLLHLLKERQLNNTSVPVPPPNYTP